jgi:hypothetical protein
MEAIFSQNQMGGLGGTGIGFEGKSSALDLDITGNTIAGAGLAPAQISAGILLRSTTNFNVKINENVIESIGPGSELMAVSASETFSPSPLTDRQIPRIQRDIRGWL